ncbi:MAG TPA: peptide ligase PGM1-related protein [Pseudonocardiaceae bacterium]|nr:peptide ligase PGM1-related protein [Pseudonocardiaceae bacterium]
MTRILIGNDFSEDVRTDRGWTGWWVQRLLWFAEDGDVLVLPSAPEDAFLRYVTGLTGTRPESLRFVTPQAGSEGSLTPDRLADPELVAALRAAVGGRSVADVLALWPDAAVCRLARLVGAAAALPGYGFVDQGGGILANSKSFFRTIAAGIGVPIPPGAVCTSRQAAEAAILDLLDLGHPVIVKHDYLSGGRGNEILSTEGSIRPVGARRTVRVDGRADVREYLDRQWDWLSSNGRGRPVAESYCRDSSAFFAEYRVTDDGVHLGGDGELLSAPFAVGQVMPAVGLEPEIVDALVDGAGRLAEALRAIGYRGVLCPDAVVTPEREVLFTEFNGRVTGSTHIYDRIGRQVVGPGYGRDRIILDRVWPEGWSVESFSAMVRRLGAAGLAYDPAERTGVVLTTAFDGRNGVMYCIVAEDLAGAWARDRQLKTVFSAV